MDTQFEPQDFASLTQKRIELESALERKAVLVRSVVAENAGILLAVSDAIDLIVKFAAERGIPADQAEMLPAIKTLRTALNVPSTLEVLKTLAGIPGMLDKIAPKGEIISGTQLVANS